MMIDVWIFLNGVGFTLWDSWETCCFFRRTVAHLASAGSLEIFHLDFWGGMRWCDRPGLSLAAMLEHHQERIVLWRAISLWVGGIRWQITRGREISRIWHRGILLASVVQRKMMEDVLLLPTTKPGRYDQRRVVTWSSFWPIYFGILNMAYIGWIPWLGGWPYRPYPINPMLSGCRL